MKKIKIFGLIITLILFILSCEEEADHAGKRNAGVVPLISNVDQALFFAADLNSSFVEFDVSLAAGDAASGGSIEVSFNGQAERVEIQTISSFPAADIVLTAPDIIAALGMDLGDVTGGDVFNIEVLTTNDGLTTRSNAALNVPVACVYDPLLPSGSYNAYSSEDFWNVDGIVTLAVDATYDTIIYVTGMAALDGLTEDLGPLVMHIDTKTYEVTADKTVLASGAWGYDNFFYEGYGTFESCGGTFTMYFTIGVDQGTWGTFPFTLTKI